MEADVIVVGAGYSGLAAARLISKRAQRVVVLEASARIGGRAHTHRSGDAPVDLGGQWIGPDQTRINAHARDLGLRTYPSYTDGLSTLIDDDKVRHLTPLSVASFAPDVLTAIPGLLALRRWMTHGLDDSADAAAVDQTSVGEWMRMRIPSARLRRIIGTVVRSVSCREPDDLSMLFFVEDVRKAGGLKSVIGFDGGAQQDLFVDGADQIPRLWAEELDVRLNSPVVGIEAGAKRAVVDLADGTSLTSQQVIVAIPPTQARKIVFEPGLPAARRQMLDGMVMGRVLKAFAIYSRPFWRDDGHSGTVSMTTGPATLVADVSQPGGPGHLCIIAAGHDGDRLAAMPADHRRRSVLNILGGVLGKRATEPVRWVEKIWMHDPWVGGGYGAVHPVGGLSRIRREIGGTSPRLAWAGSDTSEEFAGYFEGAIRAGESAAETVLERL